MKRKQKYVLVYGQVFQWEEKAPFVNSGKSVLGAIEYDKESDKLKCHECAGWYAHLGSHVSLKHSMKSRDYKAKHGLRAKTSLANLRLSAHYAKNGAKQAKSLPTYIKTTNTQSRKHRQNTDEMRNMRAQCDAQLAARVKRLGKSIGRTPTSRDMRAAGINFHHYPSIRSLQKAAGLNPNANCAETKYSTNILIELMRDFYVLNKRLPSGRDFSSGSLPSKSVYVTRFGSIINAFHEAGLGLISRTPPNLKDTPDNLLEKIRGFYGKHNRAPVTRDFGKEDLPSLNRYHYHFGTRLKIIYEAAGLSA